MSKRLLLWDIDGTLVHTGGAGVAGLIDALREHYGIRDDLKDIEIAGRTDIGIIRDILRKHHLPETEVAPFSRHYIGHLRSQLPRCQGHVLPGIERLLSALKEKPDLVLGLLTGNLQKGAELKLSHYKLWHFFEFGAFADDHHDRNELVAFAHRRAKELHGHSFAAADIDVIGDTPHDIACGKAFGARTIAVATGRFTAAQLAACAPDHVLENFADEAGVRNRLGWN